MKNTILPMTCLAAALTASATAATVFSNNFEDGNLTPETGTWTFGADSAATSVVAVSGGSDATLGSNVALVDRDSAQTNPLDLTLNLTNAVTLTSGNTVSLDFDIAARRTNGNSKTIFVDALDSSNTIVARFVLGDANAFGNGGGDRQRPGYDPSSAGDANTGNSILPGPGTPGNYWWGADTSPADFASNLDAHVSLTYSDSSFDLSTTSKSGTVYSTTALSNYDSGTYSDIATIRLTSIGTNYGVYLDNIVVEGTVVPEPSSAALLGLGGLALILRRRK
ncbi:PEP-CTERM sorting domain-containing protein [Verrucomicrobiaceae bacterium R5-34]|nr:PEP-CTERM sorting domain-containing protein [Verrucomicrobiaceae bacterium R5-34]